jgi:hypothetical protein
MRQKNAYQNKQQYLTQDKIDKLNSIGFVWNRPKSSNLGFPARLEQCRKFKEKHGHLSIPLLREPNEDGSEPNEEEKSFRIWAQTTCNNYKRLVVDNKAVKISKKQIKELTALGFDWKLEKTQQEDLDLDNDVFEARVTQLKKVAEVCGNCNDKKSILSVYPNNRILLNWVRKTRRHYHSMSRGERSLLTPERIRILESIGFDFDPRRHYAPPKTTTYKKYKSMKLENDVYQEVNTGLNGNTSQNITTSGAEESYDDSDDGNYDRENPYL